MNNIANSTNNTRSNGLWTFFIMAYVLTFLTWGVLIVFQLPVANPADPTASTTVLAMILYFLGGFIPSIVGLIMAYRQQKRIGLRDMWNRFKQFNLGGKWYMLIIIIPLLVQAGTALIHKLQGGEFIRPAMLDQPGGLIPFVIAIFIGGPISEEFGWRGFAQDRVQARLGKLKGSIVLGLSWAFWHSLLFFVPGTSQQQTGNPALMIFAFALQVVSEAFLFTWIYNNTKRSLWGAVFFHFMIGFGANLLITISNISIGFLYLTNGIMWVLMLTVIYIFFIREKEQIKDK